MLLPELSGDELFDSVALEAKTKAMSDEGVRFIAIDLSPLDYIYSDTINKIIGINRLLLSVGGRVVIIASHPKVLEILNRAGVNKQVKIVETNEELNALSQLIEETFPDAKPQVTEQKEEFIEDSEEKDDFMDLKDILAESLTIGDDLPVEEPILPKKKPVEQPEEIVIDDIFLEQEAPKVSERTEPVIEEKIEDTIEFKAEPVPEPKKESEFKIKKEEEPVTAPIEIVIEQPKPTPPPVQKEQVQQPKPVAQKSAEAMVFSNSTATAAPEVKSKPFMDEMEITRTQKKTDFTKIILVLIILLLIAVVAVLLTGILSPKQTEPVKVATEEQVIVIEEQVPVVVPEKQEVVAEAPKPEVIQKPTPPKPKKAAPAKPAVKKQAASSDMISVATTPAGALIFVNNDYIGKSPIDIKKPQYGNLVIRAELSGFDTHEWNIDFDGGKRNLKKSLERKSVAQPVAQPTQTQQQPSVQQQNQQLAAQQEAQRKAAAEQAAREQAARDEALKQQQQQQLQQQQAAQQEAARVAAQEQAAREQAARDEALRQQQLQQQQQLAAQQEAQRKAAAEQAAREEAAAKAAAEAAQEAEIFFSSMPPNAEIFLNGSLVGKTNVTPVKVKPGNYKFEFKKDGKTGNWSGTLKNGKNPAAMIRLQ